MLSLHPRTHTLSKGWPERGVCHPYPVVGLQAIRGQRPSLCERSELITGGQSPAILRAQRENFGGPSDPPLCHATLFLGAALSLSASMLSMDFMSVAMSSGRSPSMTVAFCDV